MRRFRAGPVPGNGYALFRGYEQPFPEFPAFDHLNEAVCTAQHVLPPHAHPTFEICYFVAGRATWTTAGRSVDLGPGDLHIAKPGETHGGRPDPRDPNHNIAIGFDPVHLPLAGRLPAPSADLGLAMAETSALGDEIHALDRRVIPGGFGFELICRRILAELDRQDDDPRLRSLSLVMVQAMLVELLVFVTRCALVHQDRLEPSGRSAAPVRRRFRELGEWLADRLAEPPSLAEMAAQAGLSPAHFTVSFKRETGLTPIEYLTRLRVEAAGRRLVASDEAVTGIAIDLGFSSSQYFAEVFKRHTGLTPSEWRRRG
jgi:AraC-like DNA-binding protein